MRVPQPTQPVAKRLDSASLQLKKDLPNGISRSHPTSGTTQYVLFFVQRKEINQAALLERVSQGARALQKTLNEEVATDQKLTKLVKSRINVEAAA